MTEKRRVGEKQGGSKGASLIITIPKKICKRLKIVAGDYVSLNVKGQTIYVKKDD